MPFVSNRGQRIHYTVDGSGPLVVLQHGLLMDAAGWKQSGIVDALTDRFRVACVDSLGHGFSDKPSDPLLYSQRQRAGDIVAAIDDLGYDHAHLVGYSMGGWLAVGAAKYYP
jgi:pimeloyl-ACP methyl ester carboxylesterase